MSMSKDETPEEMLQLIKERGKIKISFLQIDAPRLNSDRFFFFVPRPCSLLLQIKT